QDLLLDGRYDEAIVHCRHILSQYPRHIETYCLLGEACLEKGAYDQAKEFFQRALSADPENLMARVGMGLIEAEQGTLPEAIWHMMRAYELAPGNTQVAQELRKLYLKRDGEAKERIELTRGALGRLYARSALFTRAAAEFRAVLSDQPDLADIRVALAENLWREGRRLDAVETSLDLLEELPDCLKANLILGEIWMRSGHTDAAKEKLGAARALDPENLRAQEMMGRDSPLSAEDVRVRELGTAPGAAMEAVSAEQAAEVVAASVMLAPMMDAVLDTVGDETEEFPVVPVSDRLDLAEPPEEGMPSWLAEIEADGEAPEGESASAALDPDVPEAEPPVPEWLRAVMTTTDEEEGVSALQQDQRPERSVAEAPEALLEVPDWLRELEVTAPAVAAAIVVDAALDEPPSDADDLVQEAAVVEEALLVEGREAPAILEEEVLPPQVPEVVDAQPVEKPDSEPVATAPSEATADLMVRPEAGALVQEDTEQRVGAEDDDLPPWVREMESTVAADGPLLGSDLATGLATAVPYAMIEDLGEGEFGPSVGVPAVDDDLPSWVRELEAIAASKETAPAADPAIDATKDDEVMLTPEERSARMGILVDQLESEPANYAARMELARLYRAGEDWDSALGCYEELIAEGERLPEVIAEMKRLEGKEADQERFYRLMGDAYIKSNQLEEAAEMYRLGRQALE
ncbi:tetratricopeptide repeat protein, partial [Chloroflexota bacterium]